MRRTCSTFTTCDANDIYLEMILFILITLFKNLSIEISVLTNMYEIHAYVIMTGE